MVVFKKRNSFLEGIIENVPEYSVQTSKKTVSETVSAITATLKAHGITIFSHIDHGKEALQVKLPLQEEQLIVFGDPAVGTYLMQENPLIGIELPLKILIWSDQKQTHIAFPNVLLWQRKFGISKHAPILEKIMHFYQQLILEVI